MPLGLQVMHCICNRGSPKGISGIQHAPSRRCWICDEQCLRHRPLRPRFQAATSGQVLRRSTAGPSKQSTRPGGQARLAPRLAASWPVLIGGRTGGITLETESGSAMLRQKHVKMYSVPSTSAIRLYSQTCHRYGNGGIARRLCTGGPAAKQRRCTSSAGTVDIILHTLPCPCRCDGAIAYVVLHWALNARRSRAISSAMPHSMLALQAVWHALTWMCSCGARGARPPD